MFAPCAERSADSFTNEQVELLELDAKSIRVAKYLTELPPIPLLRARLQQAITHARESAVRHLLDEGLLDVAAANIDVPATEMLRLEANRVAAAHANLQEFLPLFVIGLLLTRAYERSGNIAVPMVFHALFNLNNIALVILFPELLHST